MLNYTGITLYHMYDEEEEYGYLLPVGHFIVKDEALEYMRTLGPGKWSHKVFRHEPMSDTEELVFQWETIRGPTNGEYWETGAYCLRIVDADGNEVWRER